MSHIEWQSIYETGITEIDEQNQGFVGLINELEESVHTRQAEASAEEVLVKLIDYIRCQFAVEERLMAENQYDKTDHHAELHQQFVHRIATFLKTLQVTGSFSVEALLSFLKGWLIEHILREDTKLRQFSRPLKLS